MSRRYVEWFDEGAASKHSFPVSQWNEKENTIRTYASCCNRTTPITTLQTIHLCSVSVICGRMSSPGRPKNFERGKN